MEGALSVPVARVPTGRARTHQHEGVHDLFTGLQTRSTCHFQKQIRSCFLNLKKKSEGLQGRIKLPKTSASALRKNL